jgi:hypothetical protein
MTNDQPAIVCTAWRKHEKNTLRGFADLYLTKVRMTIMGCMLHEKNGWQWVSFPSTARLDAAGNLVKEDGKTVYNPPVIKFDDNVRERFMTAAIAAIGLKAAADQSDTRQGHHDEAKDDDDWIAHNL